MIQTPNNISSLLGKGFDHTVNTVLENPDQHPDNLVRLSNVFNIKMTFTHPVTIRLGSKKQIENVVQYIFKGKFFIRNKTLYYVNKKDGRTGCSFPTSSILSYEVDMSSIDHFENYEQFKRNFDLFFITEDEIQNLWNSTSAQHGGKYKPSDFKALSSHAKFALKTFLYRFKGINSTDKSEYTKHTIDHKDYYVISAASYGTGNSNFSRDIRISHQYGFPRVFFSSEFHGCANGTYGIIANKNKYLWTEND